MILKAGTDDFDRYRTWRTMCYFPVETKILVHVDGSFLRARTMSDGTLWTDTLSWSVQTKPE